MQWMWMRLRYFRLMFTLCIPRTHCIKKYYITHYSNELALLLSSLIHYPWQQNRRCFRGYHIMLYSHFIAYIELIVRVFLYNKMRFENKVLLENWNFVIEMNGNSGGMTIKGIVLPLSFLLTLCLRSADISLYHSVCMNRM